MKQEKPKGLKNENLPIHPCQHTYGGEDFTGAPVIGMINASGITKREYFVALAMQGLISNRELQKSIAEDKMSWAQFCIKEADEVLKELDK